MDESLPPSTADRAPVLRFGPDRRLTAGSGVLAVIAAGIAGTSGDPAARLLFAVAAAVLLAYTVADLVCWPRLTATSHGLELRSPAGTRRYAWAEVTAVRADARQRLGLRSVTLEVDAAEELHVLSRRALGADPEHVATVVRAMAPRAPGSSAR